MDGFQNVFVSTSPSSVPAKEPEQPKVPTESERLEKEVNNLKTLLQQQASAADRKINEQTTSIQALKKTLEDALAALKVAKAGESKKQSTVNEQWNMFNPSTKSTPAEQPKEEDMNPEEVEKLVQKKVEELARSSYQYQQSAKAKEEELVSRFQSEEFKDLHKHAPKVGALWQQFAQANPQEDPDVRFQRTIIAARQLLQNGSSPVPEGGDYAPTGGSVSSSQKKGPRSFNDAVGSELQAEKERHAALEEYTRQRVRQQNERLGYDYSKLM